MSNKPDASSVIVMSEGETIEWCKDSGISVMSFAGTSIKPNERHELEVAIAIAKANTDG